MRKELLPLVLIFITQLTFAQKVSFNILEHKAEVDDIGAITLYVEVVNKSKNDITILKPATDFRQKWRYYSCDIQCEDMPMWISQAQKQTTYAESDLLLIPAKSKVEISINGRKNAGSLACNSEKFQVKLSYDVSVLMGNLNAKNLNADEIAVLKKLTQIKIESKATKIEIL